MVRFAAWKIRFPHFKNIEEEVFELFRNDAVVEMGESEERWAGGYHQAMANLIAHRVVGYLSSEAGDHQPLQIVRTKQVDDVMVEYGVSRDMRDNLDPYTATKYGQEYLKWRKIAFSGPRII